ncbi:hypothetical protein RCL_jg21761.t1 [Rhizophagus clarus]|uniref:Uncharacterized protein n=1 Tax=Rhizophagus clarus TaxID=94130 RepID=A0A8H3QGH8_9GLOM|nr:hypothetical protein RCL_jg21761.t1 [Rhizophagus clarus]
MNVTRVWAQFDSRFLILGYYFYPYYRALGFQHGIFRNVCQSAIELWINMDGVLDPAQIYIYPLWYLTKYYYSKDSTLNIDHSQVDNGELNSSRFRYIKVGSLKDYNNENKY